MEFIIVKKFFSQIFQDVDSQFSSKRVVVFISVLILIITWVCNLFFQMKLDEFIFEGFLYITVVGLGVVAAEKFSRKGTDSLMNNSNSLVGQSNDISVGGELNGQ